MNPLYLLVGIDTLDDRQWDRRTTQEPTFCNILNLPTFHARLARHGVRPTYFPSYVVVTEESCAPILRDLHDTGTCEIGVHHQSWATPPCPPQDARAAAVQGPLPVGRFEQQLERLTAAVESVTSAAPVSYRGARGGLGARHVSTLERLGYTVESSLVPWARPSVPPAPYYLSYDDLYRAGTSDVLEIPATAAWSRRVPRWLDGPLHGLMGSTLIERAFATAGVVRHLRLEPSTSSLLDMTHVGRRLEREGPRVLNVRCRSSDTVIGGSVSDAELDRFFDRLDSFLRFATEELDAVPVTFAEFRMRWSAPAFEVRRRRDEE